MQEFIQVYLSIGSALFLMYAITRSKMTDFTSFLVHWVIVAVLWPVPVYKGIRDHVSEKK